MDFDGTIDKAPLTIEIAHRTMQLHRIRIGAGCWIGAQCFVGPGVEFGPGSRSLAGAVVVKNVPAGATVKGTPAT